MSAENPVVSRRVLLRTALLAPLGLAACGSDNPQIDLKPSSQPSASPTEIRTNSSLPDLEEQQKRAETELQPSYLQWKKKYLTTRTGSLDVVSYGDFAPVEGHRLSEGRGYGMVLAGMMGDRETMDGLIKSDKSVQNPNGLSPWDIDEKDKVVDTTAATDGDEDMAFGAILADKLWGKETDKYRNYAKAKITALMANTVEEDTYVLKPGDTWGGSEEGRNAINPSYLRPYYYPLFAQYTDDKRWEQVNKVNTELVKASANPTTGLVPDWATTEGKPVTDYTGLGNDFAWDAARSPIFLAQAALATANPDAISQLTKINATLKKDGPGEGSERKTTGEVINAKTDALFASAAAAASIVDTDSNYRKATLERAIKTRGTYYGESLRLITLGIISGKLR